MADQHIGFARFGLGLRPGDDASQPRQQFLAEIEDRNIAVLSARRLLDSQNALAAYRAYRRERRENSGADGASTPAGTQARNYTLQTEMPARIGRIAQATPGFAERLVMFWTNHFSIEADNGGVVRALSGPFEREAIRPHILGSFEDLLFATTQHPAMLAYLNNASSVGPNSRAGRRRGAGLNENHARELMELHTLGVDGGYSQADVTSLAQILTGWSVAREGESKAGLFVFRPQAHEPGPQVLLGQDIQQRGRKQGEAALHMLAQHPSTARHLATKLARHFVADTPPSALVDRLESTFTRTRGDLQAVSRTLIEAEESWTTPPTSCAARRNIYGLPAGPWASPSSQQSLPEHCKALASP